MSRGRRVVVVWVVEIVVLVVVQLDVHVDLFQPIAAIPPLPDPSGVPVFMIFSIDAGGAEKSVWLKDCPNDEATKLT